MVLKHQGISIHSADSVFSVLDQFYLKKNNLHVYQGLKLQLYLEKYYDGGGVAAAADDDDDNNNDKW